MNADRTTLALLTLLLALAAAVAAVALPAVGAWRTQQEIEAGRATLQNLERTIREGTGVVRVQEPELLMTASSPGRASAELQERVNTAARESGLAVRSTQALQGKQDGGMLEVALEVGFQGAMPALRDFLHRIETTLPLVVVDEIGIRSVPPPDGSPPRAMQLEASVKLRAFVARRDARAGR